MPKQKRLHKKISISSQVNKLTLSARLLFTWMIPHADDEGRLKVYAEYIKATVVPMTKWSFRRIKRHLEEIKNLRLIYYWEQNDDCFIEFVKWNEYQTIRKDRFEPSKLPPFSSNNNSQVETSHQPKANQETPQSNISESNPIEFNKSEYKEEQPIADKNPFKGPKELFNDPNDFLPDSEGEVAAKEAWGKLEPNNRTSFYSTYLKAHQRGLPSSLFYQFVSEIKQDSTIKNPGAVFNKKVEDYFMKGVEK